MSELVKSATKAVDRTFKIKAVYGRMVSMTNPSEVFDTESITELKKVDGWVQSQLDAGKLIEVK